MSMHCIKYLGRVTAIWCLFFFFGFLIGEHAWATVKPPVHLKLKTDWKAQKGGRLLQVAKEGEVIAIKIVISSGIDVELAQFELLLPEGWEFVEGESQWEGKLKKGGKFVLKATVRATSDQVGVIKGKLELPEFGTSIEGTLDLREPETSDRIPEAGELTPVSPDTPMMDDAGPSREMRPELIQPPPEPYVDPLERESDIKQLGPTDVEGSCSVTATGRLGYRDDHGVYIGISYARVILWDSDSPDGDDECGRGITDWNGNFSVSGSCGDLTNSPDIYIQLYAVNTNYVQVGDPYTAVTGTIDEFCGTHDFGAMQVPDGHNGAYQLFNQGVQANLFIDGFDTIPPLVKVNWPASGSGAWYNGEIYITDTTPFFEPQFYHEYGHFVMDIYADLPSFNYCNGICDGASGCGHCLWAPENGYIHYMEGWPDFLADVMADYWGRDNFYGFESHDTGADASYPGQLDLIEGFTAAILWDIYDSASDNQHGDAATDNLSLGFDEIWNATTNYDPGGSYDFPMTIHEFWNGFYSLYPGYRQGLWSVYAEHHINKDTTAPSNPSSVSSTSHLPGVWYNDRTIDFAWSGASDNLSGIQGYSHVVNTSSTTIPDTVRDSAGTSHTSGSLSDGSSYYFHIRAQDNAGNWNGGAIHRGPYYIDGTSGYSFCSSPTYDREGGIDLTFTSGDGASGVDRTYLYYKKEAGGTWYYSGLSETGTGGSFTFTPSAGDGTYYFATRVYDNASNWEAYPSGGGDDSTIYDTTAPTGSISINGGDLYTNSQSVTLSLPAQDTLSGVSGMVLWNDGQTWSIWGDYSSSVTRTLNDSDGVQSVKVRYSDHAGNTSSLYSDDITLDRVAPASSCSPPAHDNGGTIAVNFTSSDATSGVARVYLYYKKESGGAWTSSGLVGGSSGTFIFTPPSGQGTYYFASRAVDNASNWEAVPAGDGDGSTVFDTTSPTGSIQINGGADETRTLTVTLNLTCTDGLSGVSEMSFSNNGTDWSSWEPYTDTKADWVLSSYGGNGEPGEKTVYAQFRDHASNISDVYSDTIMYTKPKAMPWLHLLLEE